jgi:putative ABC transport system permease protein
MLQQSSATSFYGLAPEALQLLPDVRNFSRLHRADGMLTHLTPDGRSISFFETNAYYADTSFFSLFTFPLIEGSKNTVLRNNRSVALSESAARRYFGEEDAIGKVLTLTTEWQGGEYVVEAVFKDVPQNSHFSFDFIFPITDLLQNFQFKTGNGWKWTNFYTYFLLAPHANVGEVEAALNRLVDKHLGRALAVTREHIEYTLLPLQDIYLYSRLAEFKANGDPQNLQILTMVAFFVLCIAWLNYINLSTARALKRCREIGIRKTMGSSRMMLIKQFLVESAFMNVVAFVVSVGLLALCMPAFSDLVGKPLSLGLDKAAGPWLTFLLIFSIGTLLSGLYPAIYLSAFNPIKALSGQLAGQSQYFRNSLIVAQFFASTLLIGGTLIIFSQIRMLEQTDLGFNPNHKMVIKAPRIVKERGYWNTLNVFKDRVRQLRDVNNACVSFEVPGHPLFAGSEIKVRGRADSTKVTVSRTSFDPDFLDTYQLVLLAGKNFSHQFEGATAILNETACRLVGFSEPEQAIGRELDDGWIGRRIVGVVRDFHQESPKASINPLIIFPFSKEQGYLTVDIVATDDRMKETTAAVESVYREMFPENAFDYFFLEDYYARQFDTEQRFAAVLLTFTVLALLVGAVGLFGLTTYLGESRKKEIGIRKVIGATTVDILNLFNLKTAKLIFIATLICGPLLWWSAEKWLSHFATRLELTSIHVVLPGIIVLFFGVIITTLQTSRLARTNPVTLLHRD